MNFQIKVTKLGVKVNDVLLGNRHFEQYEEKVARIIDGRPERIRDTWITKIESDFYINIEHLKEICGNEVNISINQEEFNKETLNTCPQCYTNGKSNKWTSKAISMFLNSLFKTTLFTF